LEPSNVPEFPIVDSHLHLWDPGLMRYPWLDHVPSLNRPFLLEDFRKHCGPVVVEAMVFVQCEAEFSAFAREADWVAEQARVDPRIQALVAWAPLEKGPAVSAELERLQRHNFLRGIRRIIQFESDLNFCLRPDFIEGVRTLKDFNLSFDICIDHRHCANVLKFVEQLPEVLMILDHIGKPAIREGRFQPWADALRELASFPNVACKISGVATEADHGRWTPDELNRYIDVAVEAFGFDRALFAGDWPVATQAIRYPDWIALLDRRLAGVSLEDRRKFFRDNAIRLYRLAD
jgi:L-fuconolactonase